MLKRRPFPFEFQPIDTRLPGTLTVASHSDMDASHHYARGTPRPPLRAPHRELPLAMLRHRPEVLALWQRRLRSFASRVSAEGHGASQWAIPDIFEIVRELDMNVSTAIPRDHRRHRQKTAI